MSIIEKQNEQSILDKLSALKLNPVGFSACSAGFLCLLPVPYAIVLLCYMDFQII